MRHVGQKGGFDLICFLCFAECKLQVGRALLNKLFKMVVVARELFVLFRDLLLMFKQFKVGLLKFGCALMYFLF